MPIEQQLDDFNRRERSVRLTHAESASGETIIIYLEGLLDTDNSAELSDLITRLIAEELRGQFETLVLDCRGLTYASSTGIGSFVNILVTAKQNDLSFDLSRVPGRISDVMDLLGFSSYFNFREHPEEV